MKKAVYPGSFDPITLGHIDIIERAASVFDELSILIAQSSQKTGLFSVQERKKQIEENLKHLKNVKVDFFEGLTTDYMKKVGASIIVRGLRATSDFEYEMTVANFNKKLAPEIETVLMYARPELNFISSRGVKEVARNGGSLKGFVPDSVVNPLLAKFNKN